MVKIYLLFALSFFPVILPLQSQNWIQIGQDINGQEELDHFGWSVSLSSDGSNLAVGAPNSDADGYQKGHVKIYKNNSGKWTQIGDVIHGEAEDEWSGYSVSLSSDGQTVAVGGYRNSKVGLFAGHVRIFRNISGTWTQIGENINGEAKGDNSGCSISLSSDGSIIAIGADRNWGTGKKSGHVRIFRNKELNWEQIGEDIDGEAAGNFSGWSVSLNSVGSIVAIGAPFNSSSGYETGQVRVFRNEAETWKQIGDDIEGESAEDYFGKAVSLSSDGSILAVGAPNNDGKATDAGHVRIYRNNDEKWIQVGDDIDGEAAGDVSGSSVCISSDGSVIAVGAGKNDKNGFEAGHVRIYQNNAGTWTQIGDDINGKATNNYSGFSISLNSDGSIISISAPYNDNTGYDAGHVRVYRLIPDKVKD